MPRILWEEKYSAAVGSPLRDHILEKLRVTVAEEITRFDPTFILDPTQHIVGDIVTRHPNAFGDKKVMITIRGMHKPLRVKHSEKIGKAIRARVDPLFFDDLTWSLSLCWDEYYYNDGTDG